MLQNPLNRGMHDFVGELLKTYRKYPCLYEIDNDWLGFEWMNADDKDRSIYSFVRRTRDGRQHMLFVLNMTPVEYPNYKVGVPREIKARKGKCDNRNQYVVIPLPPLTGVVYLF